MRLFGTDGIRAPFGDYPLDRPTVTHLGFRLGELLARRTESPLVIIGGDTRKSTPEISHWLARGLAAAGARAVYGGVLPTPAIAHAVIDLGAVAGISVSASHNLHPYNGIKLFDEQGFKWSPEAEEALEERILNGEPPEIPDGQPLPVDAEIGERYIEFLVEPLGKDRPFAGLKMVIDTANGAATPFAERVFTELGAEVVALGTEPDGKNINQGCGSTAPQVMLDAVRETGADLGVAFDGDADRALIADELGEMRDGDAMLFLWAGYLQKTEGLDPAAVVATSMSNLGLETALKDLGIGVERCDVGDRTVVATMRRQGIRLGGEQSGHLVDLHSSTTGDGLSTALRLTAIVRSEEQPLSQSLAGFRRFPQVLRNVEVASKPDLGTLPEVARIAAEVESTLGDQGRLVLRYSGTEPLARVMIEGPEMEQIEELAGRLLGAIEEAVGVDS